MFKNNSRFASLVDDSSSSNKSVFGKKNNEKKNNKKEEPKQELKINDSNSFKNDRPVFQQRDNYRTPYGRDKEFMEMLEKQEQMRKVEEEKRKEEEKKASLSIESFPELSQVSVTKPVSRTNFIEKLKTSIKIEKPIKHIVKQGWVEMRFDSLTNEIIRKSNLAPTYVNCEADLAYEVLDNLAYLHEKRSAEYIDNWGEDEWEKMFLFPNYDYNYFDKLDEIYAKNNPNSDEEYQQFSDEE